MAGLFGMRKRHQKRTVRRERNRIKVDSNRDDFLIAQIDEFRDKAKHLQEMLNTRKSKAYELQTIVEERESRARELEEMLEEKQEIAAGMSAEVTKQIDSLIVQVHEKMREIETSMKDNVKNQGDNVSEKIDRLNDSITSGMDKLSQTVGSQVKEAIDEPGQKMLNSLEELNEQLLVLKQELSDKVHSENVMCFRNVQDLFKALDEKLEIIEQVEKNVSANRKMSKAALVFIIINTLGIVAIGLQAFGIFDMIFR